MFNDFHVKLNVNIGNLFIFRNEQAKKSFCFQINIK